MRGKRRKLREGKGVNWGSGAEKSMKITEVLCK